MLAKGRLPRRRETMDAPPIDPDLDATLTSETRSEGIGGRQVHHWFGFALALIAVAVIAFAIGQDTRPAVSTGPGAFVGAIGVSRPGHLGYHFEQFAGLSNEMVR